MTYNDCHASFESWEGISVGHSTLVFTYVLNLSRNPVLNIEMSGKMSDHIAQSDGYGVMACEVKHKDVAKNLLRQSVAVSGFTAVCSCSLF
jgi:hypothetical protein